MASASHSSRPIGCGGDERFGSPHYWSLNRSSSTALSIDPPLSLSSHADVMGFIIIPRWERGVLVLVTGLDTAPVVDRARVRVVKVEFC